MIDNKWYKLKNQKEWKNEIQSLVIKNKNVCERAILAIYNLQTKEEQINQSSNSNNGIGFNKVDANILSKYAVRLKNGGCLTLEEFEKARFKVKKYWKQLMIISKKNLEIEKQKYNVKETCKIDEKEQQKLVQKEEINEEIRKCSEEGIACDYGICSECILRQEIQLEFSFMEKNREHK